MKRVIWLACFSTAAWLSGCGDLTYTTSENLLPDSGQNNPPSDTGSKEPAQNPECTSDDRRCDSEHANILQVCVDGKWNLNWNCGDYACHTVNNTATCAECIEDDEICQNGAGKKCIDGRYQNSDTVNCGTNPPDTTTDQKICENGTTQCLNGELQTCDGNKWTKTPCKSTETCQIKDDTAQCVSNCTDGAKKCEGNAVAECTNGSWAITQCKDNEICAFSNDDYSCRSCIDGETKCENDTLKTCENGSFNKGVPCKDNQYCGISEGKAACTDDCQGKTSRCDNGMRQTCSNGKWKNDPCDDHLTCEGDPESNTAKCKCKDAPQCSEDGRKLYACSDDGTWKDTDCTCAVLTITSADNSSETVAKCVECTEEETQCTAEGKLQQCIGGKWTDVPQNSGPSGEDITPPQENGGDNQNGGDNDDPEPGPDPIDPTVPIEPGEPDISTENLVCGLDLDTGKDAWVDPCTIDACKGSTLYKCNAESKTYDQGSECKTGCYIDESAQTGSCFDSESMCTSSTSYMHVVDGVLHTTQCEDDKTCVTLGNGNADCRECKPGTRECTSTGDLRTCNNDGYWTTSNCFANGQVCGYEAGKLNSSLSCLSITEAEQGAVCNENSNQCFGNYGITCQSNVLSRTYCNNGCYRYYNIHDSTYYLYCN